MPDQVEQRSVSSHKKKDHISERQHAVRGICALRTRAFVSLAVFGLCVATSGCSSLATWKQNGFKVGPDYCRPSAAVELQWIDVQDDERLSSGQPDVAAWWYSLNDETLNGLIDQAYQQNLTLRQAGARVQQAEAIRGIAVGNLFPQLQQAVADYQRIQNSRNIALPPPQRTFDNHTVGLNAGWELDFWGRFRRSVDAADAALGASIAGYDDVSVILLSNVAATYVQIRTIQARLELTRQNIEAQQGSLAIADARFRGRRTNKLDVYQAQNNIDVTESAIPALEAQLRIANNQLCVLLGIPPRDLVAELPPGTVPTVSHVVDAGIPTDLLRRRPDIRRAERLMKVQSEQIGIAEADLYPRISLVGAFEWRSDDLGDLLETDSVFGLMGPSVAWNIWNYGRIRGAIENERRKFEESVYAYRQQVLVAQQEVEDSIAGFLKAQEQSAELTKAVEQVGLATDVATTLYRTGATDFNRVYLLQSVEFAQQDSLVIAQASEVLNLIKLYRALGGGWQIRCPELQTQMAVQPGDPESNAPSPKVQELKPRPADDESKPDPMGDAVEAAEAIPERNQEQTE